jgi:anion-transporting  ArsA/GET3 family ATPase
VAFEPLSRAIEEKRALVFCGSGGVGKTTLAAATALFAALRGKRVLVVTIDPARRLADSLGMAELGNVPGPVDLSGMPTPPAPGGELQAMMLDTKTAADELVARIAPNEASLRAVLENPIYKIISESLIGTQEYMAMGKIYELMGRPELDLVVIDTAPTRYALDFFEAPTRLLDLLDAEILGRFLRPVKRLQRFGWDVFRRGSSMVVDALERLIGLGVLSDIAAFILEFEDLFSGLRDRSQRMHQALQDPERTMMGIVFSANATSVDEAIYFARRLQELGMPLGFMIVNRVHEDPFRTEEELALIERMGRDESALRRLAVALSGDPDAPAWEAARALVAGSLATRRHALVDRYHLERFERAVGRSVPHACIPFLEEDVCDLRRLYEIGEYLFGSAGSDCGEGAGP